MIKIEYIKTIEVYKTYDNRYHNENVVEKPDKVFKDLDEAWSYAMAHGCNPWKNFRVYEV